MGKAKRPPLKVPKETPIKTIEKDSSPITNYTFSSAKYDLKAQIVKQNDEIKELRQLVVSLQDEIQAEKNVRAIYQRLYEKSEDEKKRKAEIELAKHEHRKRDLKEDADVMVLYEGAIYHQSPQIHCANHTEANQVPEPIVRVVSPNSISLFDDLPLCQTYPGDQILTADSLL